MKTLEGICPECSSPLERHKNKIICEYCGWSYSVVDDRWGFLIEGNENYDDT